MSASPNRRGKKILPKSLAAEPDLRHAMDAIPQLVWSAFPDGSVEFCNRLWLEYTGLTPEQAQGWGWRAAIHPEDAAELLATWNRVLAEGVPGEAEARLRKTDGTFRWFLIRAAPLLDDQGRIARWYGTSTDIEERKRAEQAGSRANDRLGLAMAGSASVGWDLDVKNGREVWFGDLQTIFGIPSDTYAASVEEFLRYVHPDDRRRVSEALADARQNRKLYAAEFRIMRLDGTVRWLAARGKFYYATNGEPKRMLGVSFDITERKLAEEKLREYEKAVEGAEEMIAVVDREGRYLIANRKFLHYRGMTKEQVVGHLVPEVLNKGVFEAAVKKQLDECFRGKIVRYEMKYTYPKLGERDLFVSYFPIEGVAGVERAACILQDITERKRTEEALRKSEELFRLAAKAGRMYAYEWDVATDTVMRSEEHVNVLGFSKQAKPLTRQQLLATVHPEDRALFIGSVDRLSPENPTTRLSYRVLCPDGSVVWLEKNAKAFFDEAGRMLNVVGMVTDITERKRIEEALRESEERLRLAVKAGRMYAFEWDTATDVIVRSGKCAEIFNWMDDPTRDTGRQFAARVHPDDRQAYLTNDTRLTVENPTYQINFRMLRPDGSVIWLEDSGHGLFDNQGRLLRTIGMVADVTERKLAEEALSSVSRRLIEAQEQERARIARELHDDLSQRMALLQISLEQVAQDTDGLSSKTRQQLHSITKLSKDVSSSLHDLSHQLHPHKLDTLGLVAALGGFCNEISRQHNLRVQFVHHDVPGQIPKEVTLCLFRIVQEALRNVVKHSGGTEAEVELSGHGDRIDLCISDSGAGFSLEHVKAETGLGLISMRERLRLVRGHLSVESEPSHGTRIRVRVPLFTIKSGVTGDGKAHKAGA
jgi:PAS domain S-box-containing protein